MINKNVFTNCNYNNNNIFTTIKIILFLLIIVNINTTVNSSSISISRKNKHIDLYHPESNELIISSPINNEKLSREHIHYLINKSNINKYYSNNNNNNNDNIDNIDKNIKLQIFNNSNNKIYSHLKLKSDKDYSGDKESSASILYGGITSSFEYFIPILVGSPPQMFTVQVDTGSTSLAVPGSNCYLYKSQNIKTSCSCSDGNLDGLYNFDSSVSSLAINCSAKMCNNSCSPNSVGGGNSINSVTSSNGNGGNGGGNDHCPFILKYGDGSFIAGSLVVDNVTIGQYTVPAKFGNIQKESLSFSQLACPSNARSQAVRDGILGLSYQELDPNNGDDIFSKIVEAYGIPNVFSMCLGKDGGMLTIGGKNEKINIEEPKYTPIFDKHYYSILVSNIYVGNESLKLKEEDFPSSIVDSGTTLLYFNDEIFYGITKSLEKNYCHLPGICEDVFWDGNCHYLEDDDINDYPTIYLEMVEKADGNKRFKLAIPPSLYFLKINNLHCFGISHMKEISVLIGDVVLQGYNVIYDRGESRIGFAKINSCNSVYSDNAPLELSMEHGNYQKATEQEQFPNPLILSLVSLLNKTVIINDTVTTQVDKVPIGGVIVGFSVVSGNAHFYPSNMASIRNITDIDGIVSILVVPKFFGKIIVEATVWGNNNTNTIYFTLYSSMKPWKIILISLSAFIFLILLLLIGLLVYKKKINFFNNNSIGGNGKNQNVGRLTHHYEEINNGIINSTSSDSISSFGNNNFLRDESGPEIHNNHNDNHSKPIEWNIFSNSIVENLNVNK